jgi:xylulokinase
VGTTSVKAVAVDDEGTVVARSRIPHRLVVPAADRMEHDAAQAWRRGPRRALAGLGTAAEGAAAVGICAMVPSLTAVDARGIPQTPGLIYGDARGRGGDPGDGELAGMLRWTAAEAPGAHGYWPAQAVAAAALGGRPAVDHLFGLTAVPLYGAEGWDPSICAACGANPDQLPPVQEPGSPAGRLARWAGSARRVGPVLAAGSLDVWCEQLVAGAEDIGDVHVILGTSLVVWAIAERASQHQGLWSVPDSSGRWRIGGVSNAGGFFLDWVRRLLGARASANHDGSAGLDPSRIPVWTPYLRGERTPYQDPEMRAGLHGLDLTHTPAALQRAAWEASGFVARHHIELGGVAARRIVATGGGTRIEGWIQALADATGLPVHVAAVPEGAALGAAWLARMAAGMEPDASGARRWASTTRIVKPDSRWAAAASERYAIFLEMSESK